MPAPRPLLTLLLLACLASANYAFRPAHVSRRMPTSTAPLPPALPYRQHRSHSNIASKQGVWSRPGVPSLGRSRRELSLPDARSLSARVLGSPLQQGEEQRETRGLVDEVKRVVTNPGAQLMFMSAGAILLSALSNVLTEAMFTGDEKINAVLWNFLNWSMYALCAVLERIITRTKGFKGSVKDYMQLGVLTALGNHFTYAALQYVNYTIRIVFKAAKVVPVMLVSALYVGKRYTGLEIANVLALIASITLFSVGDATAKDLSGRFDIRGLGLLSLGVMADAMTSNFEEKKLFGEKQASSSEVMLAASIVSAAYIGIVMAASGAIPPAIAYLTARPDVLMKAFFSCSFSYASLSLTLQIIQKFGAVTAETNKAMRRIVSVFVSFVRFRKPFKALHAAASLFFGLFIAGSFQAKMAKNSAKAALNSSPSPDADALSTNATQPAF